MASKHKRINDVQRQEIITHLASGEFSQMKLCDMYNCSRPTIAKIKKENIDKINELRPGIRKDIQNTIHKDIMVYLKESNDDVHNILNDAKKIVNRELKKIIDNPDAEIPKGLRDITGVYHIFIDKQFKQYELDNKINDNNGTDVDNITPLAKLINNPAPNTETIQDLIKENNQNDHSNNNGCDTDG